MRLVYLPLSNPLVHHLPSPPSKLFHSPLEQGLVMSNSCWSERGHIFVLFQPHHPPPLHTCSPPAVFLKEISSPKHLHMFGGHGQESSQHMERGPERCASPKLTSTLQSQPWGPSVGATLGGQAPWGPIGVGLSPSSCISVGEAEGQRRWTESHRATPDPRRVAFWIKAQESEL